MGATTDVRAVLEGQRVKDAQAMPITFRRDANRCRQLVIGNDRFSDTPTAIVNGIAVEIAGFRITETSPGSWQPEYGRYAVRRAGTMNSATDAVLNKVKGWAITAAPRLAEVNNHLFDADIAVEAQADLDALNRRHEALLKLLSINRQHAELAELVASGHTTERYDIAGEVRFVDADNKSHRGQLAARVLLDGDDVGYRIATKRNWERSDGYLVPAVLIASNSTS